MSASNKILQAAAGNAAGEGLYVEEVFSTYLYDGSSSTQTITNGIDLDGEGGMVWIKERSTSGSDHGVHDTERGVKNPIFTNLQDAESSFYATNNKGITAFNSNGFTVASGNNFNDNGDTAVSWTFRKAPKFFDVVTWTGDGSAGPFTLSHNLGSSVGMSVVKVTSHTGGFITNHRSVPTKYLALNSNASAQTDVTMTSTDSTITFNGSSVYYNFSGRTYVAYLFAHNDGDGDFGESGDQDIIKCGSYTGTGSSLDVSLGFEPQWILVKRTDSTSPWTMWDVMRGLANNGTSDDRRLKADTSDAESNSPYGHPTATGFTVTGTNTDYNASGGTYIYIAIRRGPMKTPESGTEVFAIDTLGSTGDGEEPGYRSPFPVDMGLKTALTGNQRQISTRLLQGTELLVESTAAEAASASKQFDYMNGTDTSTATSSVNMMWMFRRAPGFFDVVAYTGTGSARTVSHNLAAVPELMIVKNRSRSLGSNWGVYSAALGNTKNIPLNLTNAASTDSGQWNNTSPTDSVFTVGTNAAVNQSGETLVAYLFATLPGVSKVGSYTGNGTSQTIDCGFSAGARFVMTKRVNTTGNWNVWDSERGIVAGNDPRLELNTTDAEDTGHDYIDPDSSGFVVNYVADDDDDSNVSGDTYIFLAIA